MQNTYNLYNLEASFRNFLLAGNNGAYGKTLDAVSVKNYMSDFRHFVGWVTLYVNSHDVQGTSLQAFITIQTINDYKSYLLENNIPDKTINRRLSTVRKLCSFCISQGWLKENPAKKIANIQAQTPQQSRESSMLSQFEQHLVKENLDKPTITSFLDDVREFLAI